MERRSRHNISSLKGSRAGSSMAGGSISHARFSRSFLGSKSNLFSSSKKNLASESMKFQKPQAQIFDEHGNDVTPQSLLEPEQLNTLRRNQSNMFGGDTAAPSDSLDLFQQSIYGTSGTASFNQPFSRSVFSSSVTDLGTMSMKDSINEEMSRPVSKQEPDDQEPSQDPVPASTRLTEEDLDKEVNITLSETDTIWMLDIPSTCVAQGSSEAEEVKKQIEVYQELLANRPGNDRYSERGMQTIDHAHKVKQNQTEEVVRKETGTNATTWDMYDTYESLKQAEAATAGKSDEETLEELSSRATSRMMSGASRRSRAPTAMGVSAIPEEESTVPGESVFMASMMTVESTNVPRGRGSKDKEEEKFDPTKPNDHPLLKKESLRDSLRIVERAVTQNILQSKQALYRKLPVVVDPDHPSSSLDMNTLPLSTAHLEKLWSFSCPLTKKRNVTCMAWNPLNKDIVAVGYGAFSPRGNVAGLICCWSLKNPKYPERIYNAPSGITSLSFSKKHPNLLAAGLFSGSVVLYNVRSTAHDSVLDSRDALHKHSAPVWQVSWVTKDRAMGENKAESLVSISVDGKILQWSIRKGFESTQLMKLKRMLKPKQQEKRTRTKHTPSRVNPNTAPHQAGHSNIGGEAYISQHAPGMGFDFSPKDSNIYLACTEEGFIHKCSCSYNEQVLETYTGHNGPVYCVCWSPFVPNLFLSCSADWSVKLWNQETTTPLHSFHAAQKSIFDVCWSPLDSRMFACVSEGRIEIWNLEHSVLDPIILHKPISGVKQTCIAFAQDTQVVLVGDELGEVAVYLIKNIPSPPSDQEDALLKAVSFSHKDL